MTHFAIKIMAMLTAICIGFCLHASACPKQAPLKAEKPVPRREGFALVGMLDVDHDRKNDIDILRQLIRNAGGKIDAEVSVDGKVTGELRPHTKFVLLVDVPNGTSATPEAVKKINHFLDQAREMKIRIVRPSDFLSYGSGGKPFNPESIPWTLTKRRRHPSRGTSSGAYSRSNRDVNQPRN